MNSQAESIIREVEKAISGKRRLIETLLMAILSEGHVLLDDVPGVGKTTLAVAFSRALGLRYRRVQFTPDVLPSDIVGFSVYDRESGALRYVPGAAADANLLLGDEINRTSSKTQSALLEAMEERQLTVDGVVHPLPRPFCVIATQNRVGTAGTQPLPHAQMDRFLVQLKVGYPDFEAQMELLRRRKLEDPIETVEQVSDADALLQLQEAVRHVTLHDEILAYITRLCIASRDHTSLQLGLSPRAALSLSRMSRACAWLRGRDYVIVEDVQDVFIDVCAHRVLRSQQAMLSQLSPESILSELLTQVKVPHGLR